MSTHGTQQLPPSKGLSTGLIVGLSVVVALTSKTAFAQIRAVEAGSIEAAIALDRHRAMLASADITPVTRDQLVTFLADESRQATLVDQIDKAIDTESETLDLFRRAKVTGTNTVGSSSSGKYWTFASKQEKDRRIAEQEARIADLRLALTSPIIQMPELDVQSLRTGLVGELRSATILQVIDATSAIVRVDRTVLWLTNISTADVTDDTSIRLAGLCYEAIGTKQYTTAAGGTNTVFVLKAFDAAADRDRARTIIDDRQFHTWSDTSGKFTVEAKFVDFKASQVHLQKRDGKEVAVPMDRLSEVNQDWVRNEMKRRRKR